MAAALAPAAQAASTQTFLPTRLMNFFARYPPQKYSVYATGHKLPTLKQRAGMGSKRLSATNLPSSIPGETEDAAIETQTETSIPTPSTDPSNPQTITTTPSQTIPQTTPQSSSLPPNPFLPYRNPSNGRWRGARIGLRQQADLFKLARAHEIESLLPPSIKSSEFKQRRALEKGLAVKGTGEGQKVKGHKWERQIGVTMEKRRLAMEEMPEMIRLWKQRGHGRGWKKYPK